MKILLVDDEELQLIRLEKAVKKVISDGEYLSYTNPVQAWEDNTDEKIDIAFLDIEMPVISGIQLAKKLKKVNPQVNIIFVTAYEHYALDAYKLHASGYITKPANEQKVREEVDGLRYPVERKTEKRLQVKCFGYFDVFVNGEPIKFRYAKSKELLAYLVDREGAAVTINDCNAILWEEDHKSYFRNLIVDIQTTLKNVGVDDVFIKRHNECYIDPTKIDCDAYAYKKDDPDAIRAYRGEYMAQYDWAVFEF